MAEKKQINVRFDGPTLAQIEEIARLTGKSVSEILRESVNLSNWLQKERNSGARILIERPGTAEPLREVVFKT
jgi:hypothetical protein